MAGNDPKGFYKLLGVSPDCSNEELQKSFKKATMLYHPDGPAGRKVKKLEEPERSQKLKELEKKCAEINEAKEVLLDEKKRKAYDSGMFDPNTGESYGDFGGMAGGGSVFDFFSDFFGGRRGEKRVYRNKSTEVDMPINLSDLYLGRKKKYKVSRTLRCKSCDGKGAENISRCTTCQGRGSVNRKVQRGPFVTIQEQECSSCRGKGYKKVGPSCVPCLGKGLTDTNEIIEVKIPKDSKSTISFEFEGKGDEVNDSEILAGNLIINCNVRNEETISFNKKTGKIFNLNDPKSEEIKIIFEKMGKNLFVDIEIDLPSFLSGGESIVYLPNETRNILKFPSLMDSKKVLVVGGRGFNGGDLVLRYKIKESEEMFNRSMLGSKTLNLNCTIGSLKAEVDKQNVHNVFKGTLKDIKDVYTVEVQRQPKREEEGRDFSDLFGNSQFGGSSSFSFF